MEAKAQSSEQVFDKGAKEKAQRDLERIFKRKKSLQNLKYIKERMEYRKQNDV